ncbi:MAG: nucleotidyltransferase domain-containing protein [Planctomycetales bacterium]|nr:nucleotidyltransferase domain-containing protein [Planctomycetales bacterium]
MDYDRMHQYVSAHSYPLVFATISGAHLYGFPSPDSDFDLRGTHVLPLRSVLGLTVDDETIEKEGVYDGLEIDLVTHDLRKFIALMLRRNGYVLEQLLSPLVVQSSPEHEELISFAPGCITKHHAHHYLGFAATQWKLFAKESPPRVKPLLYVYRVLLTGIHLMRTGEVAANLVRLNESAKLTFIDELIEMKISGNEKGQLDCSAGAVADVDFHHSQYLRLVAELEQAYSQSSLPDLPSARDALNDLLVRTRTSFC